MNSLKSTIIEYIENATDTIESLQKTADEKTAALEEVKRRSLSPELFGNAMQAANALIGKTAGEAGAAGTADEVVTTLINEAAELLKEAAEHDRKHSKIAAITMGEGVQDPSSVTVSKLGKADEALFRILKLSTG
jgi:mannose/cellobiose epimerase-like protein (N-acyl-D-glucosamine 2-epimerase family)